MSSYKLGWERGDGRGRARTFALVQLLLVFSLGSCSRDQPPTLRMAGGDAKSGALLMEFYDCGSCHMIPGIRGAEGVVGPPLTAWGRRSLIAGSVANEADNLVEWIVNPQAVEQGTAMPAVGATPAEARDMAAYLYQLQ